jgi:hypothetical protein
VESGIDRMTHEDIEIKILPDGSIEYTIRGAKGSACESISEVLEGLGQVEREERTSEYYDLEGDTSVSVANQ